MNEQSKNTETAIDANTVLTTVFSVFEKEPPRHVALLLIGYFEANNNFFRYTIGRWNGHCFVSENCEVLNVGWFSELQNCPQMEEKKYREEILKNLKDRIYRYIKNYKDWCEEIQLNSVGELDLSRFKDEKTRIEMYLDHEFRSL